MNLSYLAPRKGLNTFSYETTFRCLFTSRRTGTAKSRSWTVDLCSDHPPGAYEMIRYGRDVFIAPHRGNQDSSGLPLISKTWRLCVTGAGGGGARLDWLCGHRALHSQRLLVLQQKMLHTVIFCLAYLGILNRRRPVHSRLNPQRGV